MSQAGDGGGEGAAVLRQLPDNGGAGGRGRRRPRAALRASR